MRLSDIIATEQLEERPRTGAARLEARAVPRAVPQPGASLRDALHPRCEEALLRCSAQSAGISIFDNDDLDELTWAATAGVLGPFEGRRFPRSNSPCGLCFSYRKTQLLLQPHRYFAWMAQTGVSINEALVVPLIGQFGAFYGTIWVMSHDNLEIHFTLDDADILADLSRGLASTIRLNDYGRAAGGSSFRPV
ncbi:hypothetical protein LXA47_30340 [Massilia sp. P8910]|uniref:hypothetical protein n=1 Tax=Massilia antarctica TaxID=2765360 RepID=UPI001E37E8B1|nr:hypothetical protein [Massilia antarctica]MCE3607869.1 hypothetical protein [Massilia antarctica]